MTQNDSPDERTDTSDLTDAELDAAILAGLVGCRLAEKDDDPELAGRYSINDRIGRGGIGIVYRGHDPQIGREIAVKFLRPQWANDPLHRQRFVEEAQIGGQLQHPGVVPVYDVQIDGEQPFFAMKLIEGRTLADALRARASIEDDRHELLSVFEKVCQTMAYAHSRGVIHRDLKPANVMIGAFGEVQVVDWGLGKVLADSVGTDAPRPPARRVATPRSADEGSDALTSGTLLGTPAYMAPEQAQGSDAIDQRTDVFALGAILCELLTGTPPYTGSRREVIAKATSGELGEAWARLDAEKTERELYDLCRQCLAFDLEKRPRGASQVADAVRAVLESAERRAHEAQLEAVAAGVREEGAKSRQRLAYGLASAVLIGLIGTSWFWRTAETERVRAESAVVVAKKAAREARRAQGEAAANLANFNRLAYVEQLRKAKVEMRSLLPPWPERVDEYQQWIKHQAEPLLGCVPEMRATLAELRERARPDPTTPVRFELAVALRRRHAELDYVRKVRAVRSGKSVAEVFGTFPVVMDRFPHGADEINKLAWGFIMPERKVFGRELEGLAMLEAALPLCERKEEASLLDSIAWARFAVGNDQLAIERSKQAVERSHPVNRHVWAEANQNLQKAIAQATGPGASVQREQELEAAIAALQQRVRDDRLGFDQSADGFLHDTLAQLVDQIGQFERDEVVKVRGRLAWAQRIETVSIDQAQERWEQARKAILAADGKVAHRLYADVPIDLTPQIGLVPIAMNPVTKLWEFYHLLSAHEGRPGDVVVPKHDAQGRTELDLGTGIVFVLIPGGSFLMGAQSRDPALPGYDPLARRNEDPPHRVSLAPFFLARHELTQGQWERISGQKSPSWYSMTATYDGIEGMVSYSHSVESMTQSEAAEVLRLGGLTLPTEAQWEYACRAGTTTPWHVGSDPMALGGSENLSDQSALAVFSDWQVEAFEDGSAGPYVSGKKPANPFGLHDMHGNMREWVLDIGDAYYFPVAEGTGLRQPRELVDICILRGGSFHNSAAESRSSFRTEWPPTAKHSSLGCRAARAVLPARK